MTRILVVVPTYNERENISPLIRELLAVRPDLEVWVADPAPLLARVRNAGSVFVDVSAVVGDYAAGATHVLPTGGLARSSGGLGLETFLKPLQVVRASDAGLESAREVVGPIAMLEGLPLHAAALEVGLAGATA